MFLDASAIIAMIAREREAPSLAGRLERAVAVYTSPIAIYEAVAGLARQGNLPIGDAKAVLDGFLAEVGAEIVPIDTAIGERALDAFDRYGKGRHAARLNMGDCFAYASALELQVPLLFKGDDFHRTDVAVG